MTERAVILTCKSCDGKLVIFEQSNYDKHKQKHPELEDSVFFPDRVANALHNPTFTIPGYKNNTTCYYYEEFAFHGKISYTKVIVMNHPFIINGSASHPIMTTHKVHHVQEDKYNGLQKQYYRNGEKV